MLDLSETFALFFGLRKTTRIAPNCFAQYFTVMLAGG